MFHALLQSLRSVISGAGAGQVQRSGLRRKSHAARRPRGLHLEMLEERSLLSTFTVTNLSDSGAGSLRDAIAQANAATGADVIAFAPSATGTITLTSGELSITGSVSINGPGAGALTVGGNDASRVFSVAAGTTGQISGLTIANGRFNGLGGAGINNLGTLVLSNATVANNHAYATSDFQFGGGIYNGGTLTVQSSTIAGNTVGMLRAFGPGDAGIISGYGGGIYNAGTLTVQNSTLSGNTAGGFGNGGALANGVGRIVGLPPRRVPTVVTISNSTIAGNTAVWGGGIWTIGTMVTINNSTIAGNTSTSSGGGGIYNLARPTSTFVVNMRNTILAGNTAVGGASDLSGRLSGSGYNLIGSTVGGSGFVATDLLNVNPQLGPLQNNGGPTQTMALLAGSRAINAGDPAATGDFDQRGAGYSRVIGGRIDIGAFEVQ